MGENNKKVDDIVSYVEGEVLYIGLERASELKSLINSALDKVKRLNNGVRNIERNMAKTVKILKTILTKDIAALDFSFKDFKRNLPLTEKDIEKYVEEKRKEEERKIEMVKRKLRKKKKEKEVAVLEV